MKKKNKKVIETDHPVTSTTIKTKTRHENMKHKTTPLSHRLRFLWVYFAFSDEAIRFPVIRDNDG